MGSTKGPVGLARVLVCSPVVVSQRIIVLSSLPLARVFPSGLNATLWTVYLCPTSVFRCFVFDTLPSEDVTDIPAGDETIFPNIPWVDCLIHTSSGGGS